MDDEGVNDADTERPSKSNHNKQLLTDNVTTYDVQDPNGTNQRRDLVLAWKQM